jgi:hypothetical protein
MEVLGRFPLDLDQIDSRRKLILIIVTGVLVLIAAIWIFLSAWNKPKPTSGFETRQNYFAREPYQSPVTREATVTPSPL